MCYYESSQALLELRAGTSYEPEGYALMAHFMFQNFNMHSFPSIPLQTGAKLPLKQIPNSAIR